MFKTARLSLFVIIILAVALAFLYLLQRQEIYDEIKNNDHKLMVNEAKYYTQLTEAWSLSLISLAKHNNFRLYINALLKDEPVPVYKEELEKVFNEIGLKQFDHIRYVRFIDARGLERVVSKNSVSSQEYRNVADSEFFRQGMMTPAGQLSRAELEKWQDNTFIHRSIPVVVNNKRIGILSITIDVEKLLSRYDYLLAVNVTDVVAMVNQQGQVLYHSGSDKFDTEEAELVIGVIKQNPSNNPIMEYQQNVWSYVKNKPYNFTILFLSKGENITAFLNAEYKKIGIVISVSSLLLVFLVFQSTRRIERREIKAESNKVITQQRSHNFASISDEIRRPINTLLGALVTLSETKLEFQQKQYADTAKKSADYLLALVNEFQDYSKITRNEFKLDKIEFDLRATVHDIAELMSAEAYKKGLEVSCLVSADVPKRVLGDATRLRQVLINLVSYAVQHTENGEVSLCISAEDYSQGMKYINIDISDTGSLVDQETVSQQITMFAEVDLDDEKNYSGEGLGLALSKQLIELMAGEITLLENSFGGNTFRICLPLPVVEVSVPRKSKESLEGKRILIVGEIENNRNALSQAFSQWGMSGAAMEEFDRVVNVLRDAVIGNNAFDVCLIDVSLSSSSDKAFEVVSQVRLEFGVDELALITLTAQGVPGDAKRAKKLGIQAYLTKPVSRDSMHEAMLRIFNTSLDEAPQIVTKHSLKEGLQQNVHRLLLAEQDPLFSKQIAKYFNQTGILVDVASEGLKAEIAIKNNVYDAVLVSTTLPGLNVFKFVKDFRKEEEAVNSSFNRQTTNKIQTPIIGLIQAGDDQLARKCQSNGMNGVLEKPYDEAKLAKFVERYLAENSTS